MSDIFREIDEELRRDNLLKLWSRYGRYIIAVVVLAVVIAGGIVAWRNHQATERQAQGQRYSNALALVRDGKDAEAAKVFADSGRRKAAATACSPASRRPSCWPRAATQSGRDRGL